jgi:iron complex transport system substrate-binding protein
MRCSMLGLICAAVLAFCAFDALAVTLIDDSARTHEFSAAPQRVATLAPSLTELVYAAGAGSRLVATVKGSDHPSAARTLPIVGDYQRVDIERLLQLKPDVVLVWTSGNSQRELAQIVSAGVPVVHIEPRRLGDVARAIERLGDLFGTADVAQRNALALRGTLDTLERQYAGQAPVSVFYQVWSRPLLTLNDQHLIADVLRLCGGRNVFGALPTLVPEVSTESVVAAKPQVILTARSSALGGQAAARREPNAVAFAAWRPLRASVPAAARGWMYTLPGDEISRQGPRIDQGARAVCSALDEVRRERDAPSR